MELMMYECADIAHPHCFMSLWFFKAEILLGIIMKTTYFLFFINPALKEINSKSY